MVQGNIWIIILVLFLFIILLFLTKNKKEHYGKMKNIKYMPLNNCNNVCNNYLTKCLANSGADADWCYKRFGEGGACMAECFYSNSYARF